MILELKRLHKTDKSTIGELSINGVFQCYTLEDVVRDKNNDGDLADPGEEKVYGKTAIPRGTYNVVITMSNRFKKELPLLQNVPGFAGIRIHSGNKAEDTEGCLLLGRTRGVNTVMQSKLAMADFMVKLREGFKDGKVTITIL